MHTTRTQAAICLEIICSFFIFLIDVNNMVCFHYLPYSSKNNIIQNEIKEIISGLSASQCYRLFLDGALLLVAFLWLFFKQKKILCFIFTFVIFLRFIYWGYDSYINIVQLNMSNSLAENIVNGESVKYSCWIIPFIVTIGVLLYYIYTQVLIHCPDNSSQNLK